MAYIHRYSRNRCTHVEEISPDILKAVCHLQDTFSDLRVEIRVELPDLNIVLATGVIQRSPSNEIADPKPLLEKIIGVRVGPGMLKILKGLIGTEPQKAELCYMVQECCEAVILSMTREILAKAPREPDDGGPFYSGMVQKNIRLYNQCAAFRPQSPLVRDVDPPPGRST